MGEDELVKRREILAQALAMGGDLQQPAAVSKPDDPHRLPRWLALIAGNGLDALSTEIALKRPGTYEANPLMRGGPAGRLGIKAGATIGSGLLLDLLAKSHPKVADVIGFGAGGTAGALGVRNLKQGK